MNDNFVRSFARSLTHYMCACVCVSLSASRTVQEEEKSEHTFFIVATFAFNFPFAANRVHRNSIETVSIEIKSFILHETNRDGQFSAMNAE